MTAYNGNDVLAPDSSLVPPEGLLSLFLCRLVDSADAARCLHRSIMPIFQDKKRVQKKFTLKSGASSTLPANFLFHFVLGAMVTLLRSWTF